MVHFIHSVLKQIEGFYCVYNIMIYYLHIFMHVHRAVGCIFGELLNNSPIFAVSIVEACRSDRHYIFVVSIK